MPEPEFTPEQIERRVLERLEVTGLYARPVAGFYHPADQAVVRDLERRGVLTCWSGDGKDRGLLLAQLVVPNPVRVESGGAA